MSESTESEARARSGSGSNGQRGIAVVELAIILPVLLLLLSFSLYFARVYLHYSVAQKAAHSAALYLATIPLSEGTNSARLIAASEVAEDIARTTVAELRPSNLYPLLVDVECDGTSCGIGTPTEIEVTIQMRILDEVFNNFTWITLGANGFVVRASVAVPYIGK